MAFKVLGDANSIFNTKGVKYEQTKHVKFYKDIFNLKKINYFN